MEQFVGKIVLTGGSARMPGMDAYIASKLSTPTEMADVFKQSAVATSPSVSDFAVENSPVLTVGMGLALKELAYQTTKKVA